MTDSRVFEAFEVFETALVVGRHWNDQEGVNASHIDDLADAVRAYDARTADTPRIEPPSLQAIRSALRLWQRQGLCPQAKAAAHACTWTCTECQRPMPATMDSYGIRTPVRCALLGPLPDDGEIT